MRSQLKSGYGGQEGKKASGGAGRLRRGNAAGTRRGGAGRRRGSVRGARAAAARGAAAVHEQRCPRGRGGVGGGQSAPGWSGPRVADGPRDPRGVGAAPEPGRCSGRCCRSPPRAARFRST